MRLKTFTVLPDTPAELGSLSELAYNLWFSWRPEVRRLFDRLDPESWYKSGQNPVQMLCIVPQSKLDECAADQSYLSELRRLHEKFHQYMASDKTWFDRTHGPRESPVIAYFSCEFGLHECLPIYSGGLGILAGDHTKAASDLGVPLVAVGLLYRQGYFRQYLNAEGMQQESYPENDWYSMPVHLEKDDNDAPLMGQVDMAGETVYFQIWRADAGRTKVYLLDTNIPVNSPHQRDIAVKLYDPDRDVRVRQEILLGIGGARALRMLGYNPAVYHINEGHSAFLVLERLLWLTEEEGLTFDVAREIVWASTVFTTHTPVPAGNERFHPNLMKRYFEDVAKQLHLTWDQFLRLGREDPELEFEEFCLTVLAIRFAAHVNGVSKLHAATSRQMWRRLFPGIPSEEVPIGAITNGVHTPTWLNSQMHHLFLQYASDSREGAPPGAIDWDTVPAVPDSELWAVHEFNRKRLVETVRRKVCEQLTRRRACAAEINEAREVLDPNILTIGFARRFATYKRAYLLLRHPDRLARLLQDPRRPLQIVIGGKAHPADYEGKDIIKSIIEFAERRKLKHRIVFIENYDMYMARRMVQGADVWLNTPRRPQEASGTSGMKAAINGVLHLSILDGWWDEAFSSDIGWAIGQREKYEDPDLQDEIEGDLLYHIIEKEIVPCFYHRDEHNLPRQWLSMMRHSIHKLGSTFNADRMLTDYAERYYVKAEALHRQLAANDYSEAKALARWRKRLSNQWEHIEIVKVESPVREYVYKGHDLEVTAWVRLNGVAPETVIVEVYHGTVDSQGRIEAAARAVMERQDAEGELTVFKADVPCDRGGRYGYTVRVLPGHPNLASKVLPGLMKWAEV